MINNKKEIKKIFNQGVLHYLTKNDRNWYLKNQILPSIIALALILPLTILYIKNKIPIWFFLPANFSILIGFLHFSKSKIRKKLSEQELTRKKLRNKLIKYQYEDAIEAKVFLGNNYDNILIDEYLVLFKKDLDKFNNRFNHKSTISMVIIGITGYFLKECFASSIKNLGTGFNERPVTIASVIIYFVALVFSISILYLIIINLISMRDRDNANIHDKLHNLKIELMKEYNKKKPEQS